jgi:hypothetical protein
MTVAVPIGGNGYELTQKNLIKMWDKFATDELARLPHPLEVKYEIV